VLAAKLEIHCCCHLNQTGGPEVPVSELKSHSSVNDGDSPCSCCKAVWEKKYVFYLEEIRPFGRITKVFKINA
jgi:hypothetical protein